MYQKIAFRIEGVAPLLVHNGKVTTNPLNPLTKEIKRFSSKRNKSDEDLYTLAKLEWLGGLYLTKPPKIEVKGNEVIIHESGVPCIPSDVLEGAIIGGAKKSKLGTQFKSAMMVEQDSVLEYEGSQDLEELWQDGNFTDSRKVRIQKNSIIRCRPIFYQWAVSFAVSYLPSLINPDQIAEALNKAGVQEGLCDYRPKFGRFVAMTA